MRHAHGFLRAFWPVFLLSMPLVSLAEPPKPEDLPPMVAFTAEVTLDGRPFPLPSMRTDLGPLFPIQTLAQPLGGELEEGAYGEGFTLKLPDRAVTFGAGSPALTRGESIERLSQPPQGSIHGLLVPLDLLEKTFGDALGYRFGWQPLEERLTIERHQPQELRVLPEMVHVRGATTLAFEFEDRPRYRIDEGEETLTVQILGDRLVSDWRGPRRDPLVAAVAVQPQRIEIRLAPGARADHYTLDRPFRLVFDIHRGGGGDTASLSAEGLGLQVPKRTAGVQTIVIDPGHGGTESGALGPGGSAEKDLTLLLAQALQRRLMQRLPVKVVLTRTEDANLPLETRTAVANQNKADLFISLHVNSSFGAQAHGAETYILSMQASDPLAAGSAEIENASAEAAERSGSDGSDPLYDLQLILWDLAQSHHLAESNRFASLVQDELNSALQLRDRGVKQAPFRVLMGAAMPAVLVEVGFLSNPEEESRLQSPQYRQQLVDALVRAVSRYRTQSQAAPPTLNLGETVP
jgi:N-acetylmuramoyl-L-alanine amidase